MKNKRRKQDEQSLFCTPKLIFLLCAFMIGAILGSFFSAGIKEGAESYVSDYLSLLSNGGGGKVFSSAFWLDALLMTLIFLAGFIKKGGVLVPIVLGTKGFLMSLLITSFIRAYGVKGYFTAIIAALLCGFVALTCMLLLGMQAMEQCGILRSSHGKARIDRGYCMSVVICLLILLLSSGIHALTAPALTRAALYIMS